jgi:hypothetical protein
VTATAVVLLDLPVEIVPLINHSVDVFPAASLAAGERSLGFDQKGARKTIQ